MDALRADTGVSWLAALFEGSGRINELDLIYTHKCMWCAGVIYLFFR